MRSVAILKPESVRWFDHFGNAIDQLVLLQEYEQNYIPGHYPVQSFGTLERTISDIPERPIQSLTNWNVSVNSVYSSKDEDFSTIDLFYFLEAKNEELGGEFNPVGCAAHLFDDGAIVFSGVVNSVENSNGTTSINISERIGSPSIAQSSNLTAIGNTTGGALYWPVEITKDDLGTERIIVSKTPLQRFDGLFIYDEENNRYIECESENYQLSSQKTMIFFGYDEIVARTTDRIGTDDFFMPQGDMHKLREDSTAVDPENYAVGIGLSEEIVQAWNNQKAFLSDEAKASWNYDWTVLDRGQDYRNFRIHEQGAPFRRVDLEKSGYFYITLIDEPISVTETGDVGKNQSINGAGPFPRDIEHPLIFGSPSSFIQNSKTGDVALPGVTAKLPPITIEKLMIWGLAGITQITHYARFSFKFPKMDLPSSATVANYMLQVAFTSNDSTEIHYQIGDRDHFERLNWSTLNGSTCESFDNKHYPMLPEGLNDDLPSYSDTEIAHIHIRLHYGFAIVGVPTMAPSVTLQALRIRRKIKIPFNKAKLFAKGQPFATTNADDGHNFIIPAINSLLAAANVRDYTAAADGELPNIEYCALIKNETAGFRDKLGDLAAASSTLIRFSPVSDTFLVKSTRKEDATVVHIPRRAILEENNIFNFKTQTPKRTDVYTGIEIAWGKNIATGKYENKISVDWHGVCHNGILSEPIDSGFEWEGLKAQLVKSHNEGKANTKIIENEWIRNKEGAENMAYNYLRWTCVPLRKAEVRCIKPWLPAEIDLGSFVSLDLPGYPPKLAGTAWIVKGITDNLDDCTTSIELLEAWDIPVVPLERFLAAENWDYIATEQEENKIQLER